MCDGSAVSPDIYAEFLKTNEVVMRDEVTMRAFKAAIEHNAHLFKGAVVLEVGCGSALLSMWAAQQGAMRVIAVESSNVALVARQLVRQNRLDHIIDVLQSSIENLALPAGLQQVDIIVSKWMGACLMYNSALDDVIYARDKWLRPGGSIFPQSGNLYLVAAERNSRADDAAEFWASFAGLNLSHAWRVVRQTPLVTCVDGSRLCTQRHAVRHFDMRTLTRDDLNFTTPFRLRAMRQSFVHWLVAYFDFGFPGGEDLPPISTSPRMPHTQWKQTVFQIDAHLPLRPGDVLQGHFKVVRGPLHLDFDIDWSLRNELVAVKRQKQIYRMQGEAEPF